MNKLLKFLHLWGIHRKITLFRVNHFLAGTKERNFKKKRHLLNALDGFDIGKGTKIVGPLEVSGTLITGENCWIGKNLKVNGNGVVTIGSNCDIAPEVTFQTGTHEIGDHTRRAGSGISCKQTVGSGTWIGVRSTIVNNVHIGSGCVIAACSCVTKDVPNNTLVGGVPAKTIRGLQS